MRVVTFPALTVTAISVLSNVKSNLAFIPGSIAAIKSPAPRIGINKTLINLKSPSKVVHLCSAETNEYSSSNPTEWKEITPAELHKLGAQVFSNSISKEVREKILDLLKTIKVFPTVNHRRRIYFVGHIKQGDITELVLDKKANFDLSRLIFDKQKPKPQQLVELENILENFMQQFSNILQSTCLKFAEASPHKNFKFSLQLIDYPLQVGKKIDVVSWHRDNSPVTCLIMLSNPKDWQGGVISLTKYNGEIVNDGPVDQPQNGYAFLQEEGSAFIFNNQDTLHKITALTADKSVSRVILLLQLEAT